MIDQATQISLCHIEIELYGEPIYDRTRPTLNCSINGSICAPSCQKFDPLSQCKYTYANLNYQTFAKAFWDYRAKAKRYNSNWELFYNCFHPKVKKDTKKQFEAKFPYDVPILNNMEALATFEASKDLEIDDPAYWSKERLNKINNGNDLERRMATTDWDWFWFSKVLRKGNKVNIDIARSKNNFDRIMFHLYGDNYEDNGTYNIKSTAKEFIRLKTFYNKLKDYIDVILEFD